MILKMGHLVQSANLRVTRLERDVPLMIEDVIIAALTPLKTSIDTLTTRVESFEESDAEINEEQIGVHEENIFRDLPDLAGTVVQTSLAETSMAVSSRAGSSEVTPDTETLVQTDTPGTNA
uniref:Polyprotein protein n=1 Tax=Solanum tuberosum TaxID=4113 RepID=M1DGN7_SOLTU